MSTPEDIPEDREEQFPCNCGGDIRLNKETKYYECDTCDFKRKANRCEDENKKN